MHNIDDISQSLGILEWEVVDYEPAESRRAQLYEDRKIKYSREHGADEREYFLHSIVIGMDVGFASQWI